MCLIAIEPAAGNPLSFLVEHAFFGDVDADERRAIAHAAHRHGDALSGKPEILAVLMNDQPAVIADGLLFTRYPWVDEGHGEFDSAQYLFHRRINDGAIFLDGRAEPRHARLAAILEDQRRQLPEHRVRARQRIRRIAE